MVFTFLNNWKKIQRRILFGTRIHMEVRFQYWHVKLFWYTSTLTHSFISRLFMYDFMLQRQNGGTKFIKMYTLKMRNFLYIKYTLIKLKEKKEPSSTESLQQRSYGLQSWKYLPTLIIEGGDKGEKKSKTKKQRCGCHEQDFINSGLGSLNPKKSLKI